MIGEQIKVLRKKNDLSQQDLANVLNVFRQTVQKWETNVNEPSLETIKIMCEYFQTDYEYLIDGVFNNNNKIEKDKKYICYYVFLILSILILLGSFIFTLINENSFNSTIGYFSHWYIWYIPFYSSSADFVFFQIFNLLALVCLIFSSTMFILSSKKINKKHYLNN